MAQLTSVSVFTDNTVNRSRNFLTPIIREVHWNREGEFSEPLDVVLIQHRLGLVANWVAVQQVAKRLQRAALRPPFVPYGLSRTRGAPELEPRQPYADFHLMIGNGVQSMEFDSPALPSDPLTATVERSLAELRKLSNHYDACGWRERYSDPFEVSGVQDWTIGANFASWPLPTGNSDALRQQSRYYPRARDPDSA
ncbi:MAG: hypothetical protein U0572_11310 [Phycisphaerales bacterium]